MKTTAEMFGSIMSERRRIAALERQALVDFQSRADEAEARLDAPVTRRELIEAIDEVRNQFGGSGFPEQEAVYDAFDRLRDALS